MTQSEETQTDELQETDPTEAATATEVLPPSKAEKQALQRAEAEIVWKQVDTERQAVSDKTARLRAQRLLIEEQALKAQKALVKKLARAKAAPKKKAAAKA